MEYFIIKSVLANRYSADVYEPEFVSSFIYGGIIYGAHTISEEDYVAAKLKGECVGLVDLLCSIKLQDVTFKIAIMKTGEGSLIDT